MSNAQRRSGSRLPAVSTRAATVSSWAGSGGARPRGTQPGVARGQDLRRSRRPRLHQRRVSQTPPGPTAASARAIRLALADGDVTPGTSALRQRAWLSTPLNDSTETKAIKQVFGDHAYRLSVSGTRALRTRARRERRVEPRSAPSRSTRCPPTINLERPTQLRSRLSPGSEAADGVACGRRSNSFGFGGIKRGAGVAARHRPR